MSADGRRFGLLALSRRVARLFTIAYVPFGPVFDPLTGRGEYLRRIASALRPHLPRGTVFLRFDLPWEKSGEAPGEGGGARKSRDDIQPPSTVIVDLSPPLEGILSGMKSKTRYNVRLAQRKGVEVYQGGMDDLPLLYEMYRATSSRDQFVIRPFSYYEDAWGSFLRAGLAQLLLARYEGEVLAGLVLFHFGDKAWYMYGASTDRHRQLMPNHLLQWEAMRWAKARGCASYDMWGAPEVLDEGDPMWGVFRFKEGFGGEFTSYLGSFDFPVSRPLYWLYTVAMPRLLDLMRWRHRRRACREPT